MIGLALRGMAERKLRSVLTTIAVLLGVAMIAGTYVLTDQIRGGFTELQESVYGGVDVELAPKDSFTSQFSTARPLDERLVERVEPGARRGQGRRATCSAPAGSSSTASSRSRPAAAARSSRARREEPFNPATDIDGRLPQRSGEVAVLHDTADKRGHRRRRPDRHRQPQRDRDGHGRRHLRLRQHECRRHRRRSPRASTTCSAGSTARARSRRSTSPPTTACRRRSSSSGSGRSCPPASTCAPARPRPTRRRRDQRPDRRLPDPGAARLRRRRAARRRVHHLQHVHDHGRRANARVRDAAHAGRDAPPDPRCRGARGARDRHRRVAARHGLGLLFAKALAELFEAVGLGIPTSGLELAPRTIVVSLARRHRA